MNEWASGEGGREGGGRIDKIVPRRLCGHGPTKPLVAVVVAAGVAAPASRSRRRKRRAMPVVVWWECEKRVGGSQDGRAQDGCVKR